MISARSSSSTTSPARPSKSAASAGVGLRVGRRAVAVAGDHRDRAAREVAVVVGELGLVARLEAGGRDRAVLAEGDLAEAVVAERVGAELVHHLERVQHVAERLGHLHVLARGVLHRQVAVDEQPLRERLAGGEQHRGPDHGVELEDVLGEDLQARRPQLGRAVALARAEGERRVVVEQRVEPDVEDVRGIPRDLDAPGELGAAERDVVEAARDERARLVGARRGRDEVRAVGVEPLELLLEGGEPEEPVLLLLAVERDAVDRAGVALRDLVLGLEVRAAGAVPALVLALVDVPVVVHALHERLDALLVARVARADEEVVGGVDARHQRLEAGGVAVRELLRRHALALGRERDRLAVLVGAREEEHVLPALAVVAGEDVGPDRGVRVAEVRRRVDVVDRGRDVEAHRRAWKASRQSSSVR